MHPALYIIIPVCATITGWWLGYVLDHFIKWLRNE
jgi:hypothetical protein